MNPKKRHRFFKIKSLATKQLRKITDMHTQKHVIFRRKPTPIFQPNTCYDCIIINNGYLFAIDVLLDSKFPLPIFTVQKLTDMVPTTKIFRAMPPGGLGSGEEATWWEF